MNAVNAVLLFILVWTFTAVCQTDDDISVICDDVTDSAGKEVNLTCNVAPLKTDCCVMKYKFQYPERFNNSAICGKELPDDSCDQRNSFSCSYTPPEVMTERFRFTVQTDCDTERAEFTVSITASSSLSSAGKEDISTYIVIAVVVGVFVIILIIIKIIKIIIRNKKQNFNRS